MKVNDSSTLNAVGRGFGVAGIILWILFYISAVLCSIFGFTVAISAYRFTAYPYDIFYFGHVPQICDISGGFKNNTYVLDSPYVDPVACQRALSATAITEFLSFLADYGKCATTVLYNKVSTHNSYKKEMWRWLINLLGLKDNNKLDDQVEDHLDFPKQLRESLITTFELDPHFNTGSNANGCHNEPSIFHFFGDHGTWSLWLRDYLVETASYIRENPTGEVIKFMLDVNPLPGTQTCENVNDLPVLQAVIRSIFQEHEIVTPYSIYPKNDTASAIDGVNFFEDLPIMHLLNPDYVNQSVSIDAMRGKVMFILWLRSEARQCVTTSYAYLRYNQMMLFLRQEGEADEFMQEVPVGFKLIQQYTQDPMKPLPLLRMDVAPADEPHLNKMNVHVPSYHRRGVTPFTPDDILATYKLFPAIRLGASFSVTTTREGITLYEYCLKDPAYVPMTPDCACTVAKTANSIYYSMKDPICSAPLNGTCEQCLEIIAGQQLVTTPIDDDVIIAIAKSLQLGNLSYVQQLPL